MPRSRIVTDPPSIAGAGLRRLGFAALAAAAIRPLARLRRAQVETLDIWQAGPPLAQ
jgi:hypothetical protein